MLDRRKAPRVHKPFQVQYSPANNILGSSSSTTDISATGLRMPIFHNIAPGNKIKLSIKMEPTEPAFEVTGEVRWLKKIKDLRFPFEAGIEFTQPSLYISDQILTYL